MYVLKNYFLNSTSFCTVLHRDIEYPHTVDNNNTPGPLSASQTLGDPIVLVCLYNTFVTEFTVETQKWF